MSEMDPQVLAEECAKAMFARDRASQKLGIGTVYQEVNLLPKSRPAAAAPASTTSH